MAQATLKVLLIDSTSTPLLTACKAAKRCYSDLETEHLLDNLLGEDSDDYERLDRYLGGVMSRGHHSVIEHASFTFAVEGVSRALLGQLTRHRIASFSVMSQRYVKFDEGFDYIVPPSIMADKELYAEYRTLMDLTAARYKRFLDAGIPAEDARMILPMASETKLIMTMNARELLHFFSLRCCMKAQWEIRALADAMLEILQSVEPQMFAKAGAACVLTGHCPESDKGCGRCAA